MKSKVPAVKREPKSDSHEHGETGSSRSANYAPIALGRRAASAAIGLSSKSEWLLDPDCPVPRCDMRKPGAKQAVWVWMWDDLTAFVASRRVQPGHPNPQVRGV